ncbi:MAG: glycosyltransferase family 4 protein [Pseudomonadota bacterium]
MNQTSAPPRTEDALRILVLAPQPFFVQRGTPIAVRLLLETLAERGDAIDVVTFPGGEDIEIPGCRFFKTPAVTGKGDIGPGFSLRKLILDAVLVPYVAWRLARARYDLIIAVEESAFIAMALRPLFGVPYVFDVDSSIPEQMNDKKPLPKWLYNTLSGIEGRAARKAAGALTCCRALEELIRGHAPALPIQTLEDITMLAPDDGAPPPPDCDFDEPVVMYVGNLEPYQGLGLLLDGFAKLDLAASPARLVVIGGSAAHIAEYQARAVALGVSAFTSFLGPRPVDDLGRYLRAADIVASPRTQGRNTPMKVYSYLDSGRPLIATRLPTHTQVLDDDISMLVHPDAEDIARGLSALFGDSALRDRIADAAGVRVRAEFSREGYARKLNGFMDGVIEPVARARRSSKAKS